MAGPRSPPVTSSEAGAVTASATAREEEEQRRKVKENLEVGLGCAIFGVAALLGQFYRPKGHGHPGNVLLTFSLVMSFTTFFSGMALTLLSLNMLGRQNIVSGVHRFAARCLVAACALLSLLTLLSLLAPAPGGVFMVIGLVMVTVVMPMAAWAHWYLRCRTGGGDEPPEPNGDEQKEELDAAWKRASSITNCASAGLIGVLSNASKIFGVAPHSVHSAAYVAIFSMFTTVILGGFVMTVSKNVSKITEPRARRVPIIMIRLANALLLFSLACAALAAAFVVLEYRVFTAFAPLVMAGILCFLLRYCVVRRGSAGEANNQQQEDQEWLKAMEDLASKVMTATFGGIMSVLGGSIGEEDNSNTQAGATGMFMVVLTSAFASSLAFMLFTAAPGAARERLAPAADVLVWSSVALFAATAVGVYGVEMRTH